MSVAERLEAVPAGTARRGYFADDEGSHLHVAPRRALVADALMPTAFADELPVIRENPRRRAPVRALLDRLLIGIDGGGSRRALVDADEMLAAELVRLSGLDPRWGFMQSARVVGEGTELDHWVIGPGGVYLLNAKHLPGSKLYVVGDRFLVDGREEPYVTQVRGEARRSAETLSMSTRWDVGVTGVIVPVNDRRLVIEHFPDDVAVVDEIDVANWLVNRPEQFNKRQIIAAFNAARESTIWTPKFTN
ncbi:MAG: hypothetical protein ACOX61_00560 [Brooklawnia sp.]|jgi:hypothetical protein